MYDICCIGHITLDKIVNPSGEKHMAGGTAFYFANAIHHLPVKFGLITAVGPTETDAVTDLQQKGISVQALPSTHSVYFENIYSSNQDHRTQRVLQKADAFGIDDIANVEAKIFHLGPLLADDISVDTIRHLASKGQVSLDVQGYLRDVQKQNVVTTDWSDKLQALPYISILKANEFELEALTGTCDIEEAARMLHNWGVKEVVVTLGSKGSVIYAHDAFYTIPAYVPTVVADATGCGDTYMAGYLYQRAKGANADLAGRFASAMAGIKVGCAGPFIGTEADILEVLNKF
ncbi:PfkB family carbohydrate kinase [Mucilaginibacter lacusdianchii]|uniref:PfkB family carbohydrate kinase n=1 Tax=Mucilaginibacter lacusdianchii TaxID=2684211 RepID=UPI00131EB849|nr:PfkB family carbohydrate kinase [Mucilaginibacter sp. JXJ CY 39]